MNISIGSLFSLDLVNSVKVKRLVNNSIDIIAVIQECLAHIDSGIIRKQLPVAKKLYHRIQIAPVGIPNSELALFHTSSAEIKRCTFLIYDLDNPISLFAMDHTEIQVRRILLMLGPADLSDLERDLLGMISSMIIMNDENLKKFATADQDHIKNLIAGYYLEELKKRNY